MLFLLLNIPLLYLCHSRKDVFELKTLFAIWGVYLVFGIVFFLEFQNSYLKINYQYQTLKGIAVPLVFLTIAFKILTVNNFKSNYSTERFLLMVLIAMTYSSLIKFTSQHFNRNETTHLFSSTGFDLVNYIVICFWAPFTEELFFRGYLFEKINSTSVFLFVSTLSFGSIHLFFYPMSSILWLLLLGVALGAVRLIFKNLYSSIVFHSIYNIIVSSNFIN